MMCHKALNIICDTYKINLVHELCFSCKTFSALGTYKWKCLRVGDRFLLENKTVRSNSGNTRPLKIEDMILHMYVPTKGTTLVKDTTCDSNYMLKNFQDWKGNKG